MDSFCRLQVLKVFFFFSYRWKSTGPEAPSENLAAIPTIDFRERLSHRDVMAVRIVSYSRAIFLISPVYRFNRSSLRDKRREPSFPKLSEVKADVFIRQAESDGPIRADGIPKR